MNVGLYSYFMLNTKSEMLLRKRLDEVLLISGCLHDIQLFKYNLGITVIEDLNNNYQKIPTKYLNHLKVTVFNFIKVPHPTLSKEAILCYKVNCKLAENRNKELTTLGYKHYIKYRPYIKIGIIDKNFDTEYLSVIDEQKGYKFVFLDKEEHFYGEYE